MNDSAVLTKTVLKNIFHQSNFPDFSAQTV